MLATVQQKRSAQWASPFKAKKAFKPEFLLMEFFGEEKIPVCWFGVEEGWFFSTVACSGLCFGCVLRTMLVTQWCFHSCRPQSQGALCSSPHPTSEEPGSAQGLGRGHSQERWPQMVTLHIKIDNTPPSLPLHHQAFNVPCQKGRGTGIWGCLDNQQPEQMRGGNAKHPQKRWHSPSAPLNPTWNHCYKRQQNWDQMGLFARFNNIL